MEDGENKYGLEFSQAARAMAAGVKARGMSRRRVRADSGAEQEYGLDGSSSPTLEQ